jgi:hypothetical protein
MKFRGGEFPTGTTGNFQPELTSPSIVRKRARTPASTSRKVRMQCHLPTKLIARSLQQPSVPQPRRTSQPFFLPKSILMESVSLQRGSLGLAL